MRYTFIKSNIPSINFLKHHGILGQKWGKRNGPPYPLKPGAHSKSEVRAGWQKSVKSINKKVGYKDIADMSFNYDLGLKPQK